MNNCVVNTSLPTMIVTGSGAGGPSIYGSTYTGAGCNTALPAGVTQGQCVQSGGQSACAQSSADSGGKNCGTFNGDQVCPQAIPVGSCVSYASGGVACSVPSGQPAQSPPVPNDGSAGTPAMPSGSVSSGGTTTNYYSSVEVSQSTVSAVTNPGSSTSGGSSSAGPSVPVDSAGNVPTDPQPNAANGDCGADGSDCSASGNPLPSYDWSSDCPSFQGCVQGFYDSIQGAPILSGVSAIESAWPVGSCDIGSVTLTTFGDKSFNYGDTACEVWSQYIATPLGAIMLALWAVAGVFVVLTA